MRMMKKIYRRLRFLFRWLDPIIDIRKLVFSIPAYIMFFSDLFHFSKKDTRYKVRIKDLYPCLYDNTQFTGFDRHYIYHPAWAARVLSKTKPSLHVDISSSLHFCSIVSAFIPIDFYDFRPAKLGLSSLNSKEANLTELHFPNNSIKSLSCMHTIEHIGLGRYGDPIDPNGDIKAISELKRVLSIDGDLLFVVPIGQSKLMYNAHRIYTYDEIIDFFIDFQLMDFSLVPDDKSLGFINNTNKEIADKQEYGCGCFWFKKVNL
jgi:hypothetical protein